MPTCNWAYLGLKVYSDLRSDSATIKYACDECEPKNVKILFFQVPLKILPCFSTILCRNIMGTLFLICGGLILSKLRILDSIWKEDFNLEGI